MQDIQEATAPTASLPPKENKMGTTPMLRLILTMSLPAMFSMLMQSLYNVVDSYFVAQYAGDNGLAALSLVFPLQMLLVAFGVGTGVGINSLISRRLGEKRQEEADRAASHSITLGVFTGIVFAILGALLIRPFLEAFHPSAPVLEMGCSYAYIVTLLSIGSFVQIGIEKTIQATGNMIFPMLFQLTGAITNIILDPIMIFGLLGCPEMGVEGAAVATVIGQFAAMIFALIIVFTRDHEVHITLRGLIPHWRTIREIYRVGIPGIVMQAVSAFLTTLFNFILMGFGETAVSVLGLYYKLQSFVFMPVFGLNQGLMPIIGFNFGARNKKRIYSAFRIGSLIALLIMAVGTLIFELAPDRLLAIFNASDELMKAGIIAFRLIAICFIPAAIDVVTSTLFQAMGMGTKSLIISLLRQLVFILPAAYLLSFIGLDYVWLSFPLAEILALVVASIMAVHAFRKYVNPMPDRD